MATESAYVMATRVDGDVTRILSSVDLHEQDIKVRSKVHILKQELTEARTEIRDFELAETRIEQQKVGVQTRNRLAEIEKHILMLSQYNIFNPIEVAELSARIDMLRQELV